MTGRAATAAPSRCPISWCTQTGPHGSHMSDMVALPLPDGQAADLVDAQIVDADKDGDTSLALTLGSYCDDVTPAQMRDWTRAARAWLDRVDRLTAQYEASTAQPRHLEGAHVQPAQARAERHQEVQP